MVWSRHATVIRPLTRTHLAALSGVVDADALPGQPPCRVGDLVGASGLRSTDSPPGQALVALGDEVSGAICFGSSDGRGTIRWLHAREDPAVVSDLLDRAISRLCGCPVIEAFVAGGIDPTVAGLPADRAATREALVSRGFSERPAGRYLYRPLQTAPPASGEAAAVRVTVVGSRHQLTVAGPSGEQIAKATVSVPAPGFGRLDWIEVAPAHRGAGLGGRLLNAGLRLLHHLGARHVAGHLDDHDLSADDGHGRIGAHIVCSRAGFVTGAQLTTYSRTR